MVQPSIALLKYKMAPVGPGCSAKKLLNVLCLMYMAARIKGPPSKSPLFLSSKRRRHQTRICDDDDKDEDWVPSVTSGY